MHGAFLKRAPPPLELSYSPLATDAELAAAPILQPAADSVDNLPAGLAPRDVASVRSPGHLEGMTHLRVLAHWGLGHVGTILLGR